MSKKPQPILTVAIVSFNTCELTLQAVNSILAEIENTTQLQQRTEIIVVDNASADDSVAKLKKIKSKLAQIKIIENKKNKGFAQANNQAIENSKTPYLFLLNSDAVVQPGAINQLLKTFEQHPDNPTTAGLSSHAGELDHLGILAATLTNKDGSIQSQGGSFPTLLTVAIHFLMLDDLPLIGKLLPSTQDTGKHFSLKHALKQKKPYQKAWVGGAAVMIKRQVFEEIGLLDPNIFMYGEDVEFCLRAKHHHWDIAVDPAAKVTHLGSASSSSNKALIGEIKGYLYLWLKHKPDWQIYPLKMIIWLGCQLRLLLFGLILRQKKKAKVYQEALTLLD